MSSISRHLSYANVVATLALVFAMSGGALAAKHYLINSTNQINPKVLKKLKGKAGPAGAQGRTGAGGATGAQGPKGAEGPAGATLIAARVASETLSSGQSESGDYGSSPQKGAFVEETVTLPVPLAAGIPAGKIVYTPVGTPVTHCSGAGHAEGGYLCIYTARRQNVEKPTVETTEGAPAAGTGRFGFHLVWEVLGGAPEDLGTYTVTAP